MCYSNAVSERDTRANYALLLPSRRILNPEKHRVSCVPVEDDIVVVKFYTSNRGVPYLTIYDVNDKKIVFESKGVLDRFTIAEVLEQFGLSKEDIEFALYYIS